MKIECCQTVLSSGLRINYLKAGRSNLPTLVLLHGFPTDSRLWRHCIQKLKKHFLVIAPDLPGYGQSDCLPDTCHDMEFYVSFISEFFDAMGLKKTHLAAHDLGASAALAFAGRHPDRLNRLVVLDTLPYPKWSTQMRFALWTLKFSFFRRLALSRPFFRTILHKFTTRDKNVLRRLTRLYRPSWIATPLRRRMFGKVCCEKPSQLSPTAQDLKQIRLK